MRCRRWLSNKPETLALLPLLTPGEPLTCPHCGQLHPVWPMDHTTPPAAEWLVYRCHNRLHLGGFDGKRVAGLPPTTPASSVAERRTPHHDHPGDAAAHSRPGPGANPATPHLRRGLGGEPPDADIAAFRLYQSRQPHRYTREGSVANFPWLVISGMIGP